MFEEALNDLFRAYIEHTVCQHFCKFKEVKSKFINTHVHFLFGTEKKKPAGGSVLDELADSGDLSNPEKYTGLGHDDEVYDDASTLHHNTVSTLHKCEFRKGPAPDASLQASDLKAREAFTVWFHSAPETEICPKGFSRTKCDCGAVCYTFDREAYDAWRIDLAGSEEGK